MPLKTSLILATILIFVAGCGGRIPESSIPMPEQRHAARLLDLAQKTNDGLKSYKGLGTLTVRKGDERGTSRIAWVGRFPNLLRFEIFGLPGQPVMVVSGDGQWLYLRTGIPPEVKKKRIGGPNLRAILDVPVSMDDLFQLLAGRMPIRSHRSITLAGPEKENEKIGTLALDLRSFWGGVVERIYWNAKDSEPVAMTIFHSGERPGLRVRFEKTFLRNGFRIPRLLTIDDAEKRIWIRLRVDRFWPNAETELSIFSLTSPVQNQD